MCPAEENHVRAAVAGDAGAFALLVEEHAGELGVKPLTFTELAYVPSEDRYEELDRLHPEVETVSISGTQVREDYLDVGKPLPSWFTRPEVADILAETYPPRHRQGVCIWFTGLSGSGKSTTVAGILAALRTSDVIRK